MPGVRYSWNPPLCVENLRRDLFQVTLRLVRAKLDHQSIFRRNRCGTQRCQRCRDDTEKQVLDRELSQNTCPPNSRRWPFSICHQEKRDAGSARPLAPTRPGCRNSGSPWPSACSDDDAIYLLENTFFFRSEMLNSRKKSLPIPPDLFVP